MKPWKICASIALWLGLAGCSLNSPTPPAQPTVGISSEMPTAAVAATAPSVDETFIFGLVLQDAINDQGNSQAHYEAGQTVQDVLPNTTMIYVDRVNEQERPGVSVTQLAEDLAAKGAKLVIFTDPSMETAALEFAEKYPGMNVLQIGGDAAWKDGRDYRGTNNLGNLNGRLEYSKMIAGCAAALSAENGMLGYQSQVQNDEARRMESSAYLGAQYCWTQYLGKDAGSLRFIVSNANADVFYNTRFDVLISGIDTPDAGQSAGRFRATGQKAWVITDNQIVSCAESQEACLGNVYYNWIPAYLAQVTAAQDGYWASNWEWKSPDWTDINSRDTSAVGFQKGPALSAEAAASLDRFIAELAGGLTLWQGPLELKGGISYLPEQQVAVDAQVWYLPEVLNGIEVIWR